LNRFHDLPEVDLLRWPPQQDAPGSASLGAHQSSLRQLSDHLAQEGGRNLLTLGNTFGDGPFAFWLAGHIEHRSDSIVGPSTQKRHYPPPLSTCFTRLCGTVA
jgi:hypothetical protein